MNRPTRSQWIVLWLGAFWVLLSLAIAEDWVVRAAVAGLIVTALLLWQLSPNESNPPAVSPSPDHRPSHFSISSSLFSSPSADPHPPNEGPDAEFMGEALAANFLVEHFQLKEDDFARLTSELPTELRGLQGFGSRFMRVGSIGCQSEQSMAMHSSMLPSVRQDDGWNERLTASTGRISFRPSNSGLTSSTTPQRVWA